ncbi:MAG: NlpC/P60 family protein [Rhodocyclaceae bacterium]|nr:NlpC/P60 family protein [Rhodocyclaceae bacterium]
MTTREALVNEALTWIDTPFRPNQMCKGAGADCIGVCAGIALACGIEIRYRADYPMTPDGSLTRELRAQLVQVHRDPPLPGDILMMTFEGEPHHVALCIGDDIVHAYAQVRRCVRQPYDDYWRSKTRGVFAFKELA